MRRRGYVLAGGNSRRMGVAQYVAGHPIAVGLQLGRPISS